MGNRLARRELSQEIKVEREALNTLLKQIKPRQMTLPGVTPGGRSVKPVRECGRGRIACREQSKDLPFGGR